MKLSVVLFVALMASVCANDDKEEQNKLLGEMQEKCLKESGTTSDEVQACRTKKKECPKVDCFDACCMRESGYINKDGTVNKKVKNYMISELPKLGRPKTLAAVKKCLQDPKKKTSFCESGHLIIACLAKEPQD